MYLQEILEVAIGLVFVWFIISMFAMTIQEWIATMLKWRSNGLQETIIRMLDDPNFERGFSAWWRKLWNKSLRSQKVIDLEKSFSKKFYGHQLIRVLSTPYKKPSYISPGKFADVIMDIVLTAGSDASFIHSALDIVKENINVLVKSDRQDAAKEAIDSLLVLAEHAAQTESGSEAVEKLQTQVDAFAKNYPATKPLIETLLTFPPPDQPIGKTLQRLGHGILVIGTQNEHLRDSLKPLLLNAEKFIADEEQALAKARQNVENWFTETMDRMSGVYKRRAQAISFIVGVFLALLVNIDSVTITEALWREPTLRQALIAQAEMEVAQAKATGQPPQQAESSNPVTDLQDKLKDLNLPFGWTKIPRYDATGALCKWMPTADKTDSDRFGIKLPAIESFNDIKLVLTGSAQLVCYSPAVNFNSTNGLKWLLGILITGGAASQGAPFWFEILSKLVNVRSVGIKPEDQAKKKG
jgi:hypothetical protein